MFQGNCLVINTGVSPAGITEIKLRPETATATFKVVQWFTSPAKISREILAIALSAMTTKQKRLLAAGQRIHRRLRSIEIHHP
jgi:hypothetical protein